ncbi:MAG: glycosyltransferase family 2 protein [Desulfobacterales bacterium]
MNSTCSIFIPLYNEEDLIEKNTYRLMDYLKKHEIEADIILGSNGSTDATPKIISTLENKNRNIKSFHLPGKGPGLAFVQGADMASSEFIISCDADLSVELDFIPLALDFLEKCDMVIGCKRMQYQDRTFFRTLGSNIFIFTTAMVLGAAAADFSIGAKAYRRSFVLQHAHHLDPWTAYVLELFFHAIEEKRRILEIPVACSDNRASHFSLASEAVYKFKHLFRFALHTRRMQNHNETDPNR